MSTRPLYLDKRIAARSVLLVAGACIVSWVVGAAGMFAIVVWKTWRSGRR